MTSETGSVIINSVTGAPKERGHRSDLCGACKAGCCNQSNRPATSGQRGSTGTSLYAGGTLPENTELSAGDKMSPGVNASVDASDRTRGLLRGFLLILNHHDAPKEVVDSFKTQAIAYLTYVDGKSDGSKNLVSEAIFFKRAKYLTVRPMADYLKCENMPKVPDLDWNPSGHYKKWSRTRLHAFTRRNTHLWYSFLQAKRAALPLSDELVLTTYEEHRIAMSLEDPIDEDTLQKVMKELEPVLSKIEKTLVSNYKGKLLTHEDHMEYGGGLVRETRRVASTRACFEASRAKGGQLGYLRQLSPTLSSMDPKNPTNNRTLPDLKRMSFYPMAVVGGRVRTNVVIEEYWYPSGEVAWTDSIMQEAVKFVGGVRLRATIQAVLEPLKVRVISKGNAVPYYLSKPLQVALHDIMRKMPCFRLIGRPLCPTDLYDLAQNRSILGHGRYEWFSIDYSAATDKLSASLSSAIMHRLLERQDETIREMWLSVLAPHYCKYPFPYGLTVKPIQQKNGQLMGSILSFPILCLANLGLYLANIADDTRPLKDKLAGVLVNGDDMLYVAKHSMWDSHVAIGNKVGLTMSPGKAYAHSVYANANSACFHYNLYDDRATPFSIPFLNSGLYFGQNKVLGGDDHDVTQSKTSVIQRLVDGARPGRACDILAGYINRHRAAIDNECRGRNLFIPQSLGGMGQTPPYGWRVTMTVEQQYRAHQLYDREPYGHLGGNPMPAGEVPEGPQILRAPWLVAKAEVEPYHASRTWKSKYEGKRILSKQNCLLPFQTCRLRRDHARSGEGFRGRSGNPFVSNFWIDAAVEDFEWEIRNTSSPNHQEAGPWTKLGNDLGFILDWEEVF